MYTHVVSGPRQGFQPLASFIDQVLMRLVMMGTGTFAEPTFEALLAAFGADVVGLVTQPERDAGNKRGSTRQTGKGMSTIDAACGVAVIQPESINTPEGLDQLRGTKT